MDFLAPIKRILSAHFPTRKNEALAPDISSLLDLKQERISPALCSIIDRTHCNNIVQSEPHGERWLESIENEKMPHVKSVLQRSLQGATLIDVGVSERWESMHKLAKLMGASQYIGIDKFWPTMSNGKAKKGTFSIVKSIEDEQCPALLLKGDALEFLSRLGDSSCCIAINAIDGCIISSPVYHRELARQIERIVPKGGVAFGIISHPLSLIATNSVEAPIAPESANPLLFSAQSVRICTQIAERPNPLWKDYSPMPLDRLLVRE